MLSFYDKGSGYQIQILNLLGEAFTNWVISLGSYRACLSYSYIISQMSHLKGSSLNDPHVASNPGDSKWIIYYRSFQTNELVSWIKYLWVKLSREAEGDMTLNSMPNISHRGPHCYQTVLISEALLTCFNFICVTSVLKKPICSLFLEGFVWFFGCCLFFVFM